MTKRTDAEKAKEQEAISLHYQEEANKNKQRQKRDGVVVTPTEVVDFQILSTIAQIKQIYNKEIDDGIEWLDPFGGSGIYTARLLQIADLTPERKYALSQNCIVIEICPIAAQICANNLAKVLFEETGINGFIRVICTDTFALSPDTDLWAESLPVVYPQNNPFFESNFEKECVIELGGKKFKRKHAITDAALAYFRKPYPEMPITKTDVYFFIYGFLHSEEYQTKYANNLRKELPRIPALRKYEDFKHFENAGRELAFLHLKYDTEKVDKYNADIIYSPKFKDCADCYCVKKMKFGKNENGGKDKTTVVYNDFITVKNVPLDVFKYMAGAKTGLEWVMERQSVTTHKEIGITNDANDWAIETMNNPKYPLELLLRVITVSLKTVEIVKNLPKLDVYRG